MAGSGAGSTTVARPYVGKRAAQVRDAQRRWRKRQREDRAKKREAAALQHVGDRRVRPWNWVERTLKVPDGRLAGQPFKIAGWQRDFWKAATAPGIFESGLCVARKNGKSGLIAALLLSHLYGPAHKPNWRCLVTSMTGRLAVELREQISNIAKASGLEIDLRKAPFPGHILGPQGSRIDFLAADKSTGHASGADLVVVDEAGLMADNQRALWNAMLTSVSGRDGRMISISIRGDGPMFAELRARAADDGVVWHEYSTEGTERLDCPKVWARANPGLKTGIKSMEYMRLAAKRALATPNDASLFRAFDLNSPQSPDRELLVTMDEYDRARGKAERRGWCTVGVDLGGSSSMTAACAYWPETGAMLVRGAFPGIPDLLTRQRLDVVGTRYQRMKEKGELEVYAGTRSTPVKSFLRDFLDLLKGEDIRAIAADRFRQAEAEDVYAEVGYMGRRSWRGQGWKDASDDVRSFQKAVKDGRVHADDSLVLESAIMESAVVSDPAANVKLDKSRAVGRIDAAAAAVLATGEAMREQLRLRTVGGGYHGIA